MPGFWDYHNISDLSGDPKWARASPWTRKAPFLVITAFFLSIIGIVLGAVWVAELKSDMTVPKIIQTLILPGLALFNTVPSLQLHLFARNNPPIMAIWFSSIYCLMFLASFFTYIVSCNLPASSTPLSLRRVECSTGSAGVINGPSPAMWWIVVIIELIFAVLYGLHAGMAWYVKRHDEKKRAEDTERGIVHVTSPDEAAKARERWRQLQEL